MSRKLKRTRFGLVDLLERAGELTGEAGAKRAITGASGLGSVHFTWANLVERMVRRTSFPLTMALFSNNCRGPNVIRALGRLR